MKRRELEHLIRAAAAVTDQYEIVVVGSQSVLGAVPDAPAVLLQSREADCYPLRRPDLADVIDGAIGELSPFDERFGYYAQGVWAGNRHPPGRLGRSPGQDPERKHRPQNRLLP
jgi:hypothetical protein